MILAFVLMATSAMADANQDLEKIIKRLQACSSEAGYPAMKTCSVTAAREAEALLDKSMAGFVAQLKKGGKNPRWVAAGQALEEAQRNWKPFSEAHCRFRIELNGINPDDVEWRMDDCRLTQAKKRLDEIANSYMK